LFNIHLGHPLVSLTAAAMADLSQNATYTGDFSGLLNNLWLTLAIGGVCLVGYEIEVRVPRRRGWHGTRRGVFVRIWQASGRTWRRLRRRKAHPELGVKKEVVAEGKDRKDSEYARLGDREAWEFG
jgi:hypothetical protein